MKVWLRIGHLLLPQPPPPMGALRKLSDLSRVPSLPLAGWERKKEGGVGCERGVEIEAAWDVKRGGQKHG